MRANWYKPLFELAVQLYGTEVYSYYFDLPFEETLKRHQTRPICQEFGEDAMRSWWRDNDFSDVLNEVRITAEKILKVLLKMFTIWFQVNKPQFINLLLITKKKF